MYSHSNTMHTIVKNKPRSETRPCLSQYRNPGHITLISLIDELKQHLGLSSWPVPAIKLTVSEEFGLTISQDQKRKTDAFYDFLNRNDVVEILSVNEEAKNCIHELSKHADLPLQAKSRCHDLLLACRCLSPDKLFTANANKYQLAKTQDLINQVMTQIAKTQDLINQVMTQIEKIQQTNRKPRTRKKHRVEDLSKQSTNSSNSSSSSILSSSSSQLSLFAPQVTQSEGVIQAKIETDLCVKTRKRSLTI